MHSYWSETIVRLNLIGDAWSGLERPGTMETQRKNVLEYRVCVVPGREPTRPKPNLDSSLHRLGTIPSASQLFWNTASGVFVEKGHQNSERTSAVFEYTTRTHTSSTNQPKS